MAESIMSDYLAAASARGANWWRTLSAAYACGWPIINSYTKYAIEKENDGCCLLVTRLMKRSVATPRTSSVNEMHPSNV